MKYMENRNNVTEFILLGLTRNPKTQKIIFVVFLIIYIVSMVGNVLTSVIITATVILVSAGEAYLVYILYSCSDFNN